MEIKEIVQSGDWKREKHSPAIEIVEESQDDKKIKVEISVGKEILHPNTTEHHIAWIEAYFLPRGEKFPHLLGRFEFYAHGASIQAPNTSTVYTEPRVEFIFKTEKPGTILALSYCNIHGLWQSSKELGLE